MTQLRAAIEAATTLPWVIAAWVAAAAATVALVHAVRSRPRFGTWSRAWAVAFPAAVAFTLAAAITAGAVRGPAFTVASYARALGQWGAILSAPWAVGQIVGLRPPRTLMRADLALAGTHLLLFWVDGLVFTGPPSASPATQHGPLVLPLLLAAAGSTGWWLLTTLARARSQATMWLLALGGSTTSLALLVGALAIEPAMSDHMLDVAFIPLLVTAELAAALAAWRDRSPSPA